MTLEIRPVAFTEEAFAWLLREAEAEDFRALPRLRDEWLRGEVRFDRQGEILLGVIEDGALIGVGGISHDPYEPEPGLARVRHVFVLRTRRNQGIGTTLLLQLIEHARRSFSWLRLRTDTEAASRFYERLGFDRSGANHHTHLLRF